MATVATDTGAFLSFSLGPVQPFIASARSLRDLWTGSYLLSWLTAHAMKPVMDFDKTKGHSSSLIFPSVVGSPLYEFWVNGVPPVPNELLEPCFPNRFLCEFDDEQDARDLQQQCESSCRDEWLRIADAVYTGLVAKLSPQASAEFDRAVWDAQVKSFFEVQSAVLPFSQCGSVGGLVENSSGNLWSDRWSLVQGLLAANRAVRHVPNYEFVPQNSGSRFVPVKCSILGSYEQMGPGERRAADKYWAAFSDDAVVSKARIRPRERLCAVSLIKRYALPLYFYKQSGLGLSAKDDPAPVVFDDTATVAAKVWLDNDLDRDHKQDATLRLDITATKMQVGSHERDGWSGQWLHWPNQKPRKLKTNGHIGEDERSPNNDTWNRILRKRREQGSPPIYYAILASDGDDMGKILQAAPDAPTQLGISQKLANYSRKTVRATLKSNEGLLIYSGGDDVLGMSPTATCLAGARELRDDFEKLSIPNPRTGKPASASTGIAIVHYKSDLRFALRVAKQAEHIAKESGPDKDAVAITVCRRSGAHTTVVCGWDFLKTRVEKWVSQFIGDSQHRGASDRWAYHLARELKDLEGFSLDAIQSEIRRQVKRGKTDEKYSFQPDDVVKAFGEYHDWQSARPPQHAAFQKLDNNAQKQQLNALAIRGFVTLCQSASFLARGRDR